MTDKISDTELNGKKSPRRELRESLAEELVDRYGEPENQELFEKMLDNLDHLIDEYVAGVIGEDVAESTLNGEDMTNYDNARRAEQRRRAGIGENDGS